MRPADPPRVKVLIVDPANPPSRSRRRALLRLGCAARDVVGRDERAALGFADVLTPSAGSPLAPTIAVKGALVTGGTADGATTAVEAPPIDASEPPLDPEPAPAGVVEVSGGRDAFFSVLALLAIAVALAAAPTVGKLRRRLAGRFG